MSSIMRASRALAIASCLFALAGRAHADEPSEIDKDAARTSLEQGDALMKKEDYEAALKAYKRADDIMGVPTTSIEVGRAALALGRLVLAYDAFKKAADFPKKKGEPGAFTKARKAAKKRAKELKPRIPRISVEVNGVEGDVDVEVIIDEDPIDAWGSAQRVDPGMHAIRAEAVGYEPATEQVVIQEGEERTVVLELTPLNLPEGEGGDDGGSSWWTVAAVAFPIGGASLVAGAVTGGLSLSEASTAKDQCDGNRCPPEVEGNLDTSRTLAHVSTATLVVGGVGVVLGVVAVAVALSGDDDEGDEEGDEESEFTVRVHPTGVSALLRF
jgi:hypothetical protein